MKAFKTSMSAQGSLEEGAAPSRFWCDGTRVSESLSRSPNIATASASHKFCEQVEGGKRVEGPSRVGSVGTREGS